MYIGRKMEANKIGNIVLVKSSESDANLPLSSCNVILLVNTYHQLSNPFQFMGNLQKALKPEGRIVIIE